MGGSSKIRNRFSNPSLIVKIISCCPVCLRTMPSTIPRIVITIEDWKNHLEEGVLFAPVAELVNQHRDEDKHTDKDQKDTAECFGESRLHC